MLTKSSETAPQTDLRFLNRGFRAFASTVFALDYRSLALFRISFSLVLLADLYFRAADLGFFYSDSGALSRADAFSAASKWAWSLYFLNGSWEFQALLFAVSAIVFSALLAGYRTETAAVLTWILILSLHRRNPQVLQGGDNFIRCLSFWAIFVPLGKVWSIDSIGKNRPANQAICSAGTACLVAQIVILYFFAYLMKTGDPWRVNHSAVYYALSVDPLSRPFGRSLLNYPQLLAFLTKLTLALEAWGPLLILIPFWRTAFRLAAVALFVSFHCGLLLTMELGPFPFICISAWLVFIPGEFWNRLFPSSNIEPFRESSRPNLNCRFARIKAAALFSYLALAILWNIRGLDFDYYKRFFPPDYNFVVELIGLDQQWGMFSPYPLNWDGWYVISARTKSGRPVNLTPGAKSDDPISDDRPADIARMYRTERWRKYMMFLASKENEPWRGPFVRGLLNQWNTGSPADPIQTLDIYFWFELTTPEGSAPAQRFQLWHYDAAATTADQPALPAATAGSPRS